MPTFEEGNLSFEFADSWQVVKYDEQPDYQSMARGLRGTKGVDFVGVRSESMLFLIEVKDLRGHRIQNKERLLGGELADEIGQKVRDTVAGIVGFRRTSSVRETWRLFSECLADVSAPVKVVVWLERDTPNHWRQRRKVRRSVATNVFKKRVKWLTSRVIVCSMDADHLPEVDINNLPGAGMV